MSVLLGAFLGVAVYNVANMLIAGVLLGTKTTIDYGNVATSGGIAVLFFGLATLTHMGFI